MKHLRLFEEYKTMYGYDWDDPNNPYYKESFFDRGDEDEDTWEDYGMSNIITAIEWFKSLEFPLKIYRGIIINSDTNQKNIDITVPPSYSQGDSWTIDKDVAYRFGNIVFEGFINEEDVNKEYTIGQYLRYHVQNEEEISPKDNNLIQNIKRIK